MNKFEKVNIGYVQFGLGPRKIIALHSWMDDAESWSPTNTYLDHSQFSIAYMDVRGYGKSKNIKGYYTSDEIANDVFDLANKLGWNQFSIIGHSMCGMAAQKAALIDTENRIQKVLLITPVSSAGFPADEQTKAFFQSIPQNQAQSIAAYGSFTDNRLSQTWARLRAKRHIEVTDQAAQIAYIDMWTGEDFSHQMKTVKIPFRVLSGKYDIPLFQLKIQKEQFDGFQNVTFQEIENSGHFPMQETPVFLATQIESFFE